MPGAPAAMHVETASRTSGSRPPLELRSVATLLTLTDSFIDGIDNLMGPPIDLLQILAFEHDAQKRLRSRVPYEQPAIAGELFFHVLHDRGHVRNLLEIRF